MFLQCDFDCQQSAATADQPPTSPVPQMQQLLQPPCPISFLDNLSEVAATKNKLMQILQRQQQEQGQGERGRFQQGRAFRALGLDSGCRGMPSQAQVNDLDLNLYLVCNLDWDKLELIVGTGLINTAFAVNISV